MQPITEFTREVGAIHPAPSAQPVAIPTAETSDGQISPSALRDRLARSSASPKGGALPRTKMIPPAEKARRSHSRHRRVERRLKRRRFITAAVALSLASSFVLGFLWTVVAANRTGVIAASPPVSLERRTEALRLVDDAARAKYEERTDDALAAAAAARESDPTVPGVDVLVGELALLAKQPETMKRAAQEALRRGHNVASAKLLLALDKWMSRGQRGTSVEAGSAAAQLLSEASDAELSNMEIMFFWGDIERYAGREDRAHDRLLGALHRQQPWLSETIIAAKMQLAADEAGGAPKDSGGRGASANATSAPVGDAVTTLRRAVLAGADPQPPLAKLHSLSTAWQSKLLLADQAFERPDLPPALTGARNAPVVELPGGSINPPDIDSRQEAP